MADGRGRGGKRRGGWTAAGRASLALAAALGWLSAGAGCQSGGRMGGDPQAAGTTRPAVARPNDAAMLPPPDIFLATADNCQAAADPPAAPAADVVRASNGANRFTVDVPKVDAVAAVQQTPTLCWAACTQMLLRQQNVEIDQRKLGDYFEPDPDDQTAGIGVILRALNPDLLPKLEARGSVPVDLVGITSDQMLQELMAGHLCVVGLVENPDDGYGHACVVCGATFARLTPSALAVLAGPASAGGAPAGARQPTAVQPVDAIRSKLSPNYGLYQVELFDPEPGVGRRTLDAEAFRKQAVFLTSHDLSRGMLLKALGELSTPTDGTGAATAQPGQVVVRSQTWDQVRLATLPVRLQASADRQAAHAGSVRAVTARAVLKPTVVAPHNRPAYPGRGSPARQPQPQSRQTPQKRPGQPAAAADKKANPQPDNTSATPAK